MNPTHIHGFMPYAVLGAGLIIVVARCALPCGRPPSVRNSSQPFSWVESISSADERSRLPACRWRWRSSGALLPMGRSSERCRSLMPTRGLGSAQGARCRVANGYRHRRCIQRHVSSGRAAKLGVVAQWLPALDGLPEKHEGQLEWIIGFVGTGSNLPQRGRSVWQPEAEQTRLVTASDLSTAAAAVLSHASSSMARDALTSASSRAAANRPRRSVD